MKNNFDDEFKITFENGYVAFLDVLGFKDYVNSKNLKKINTYINKVEKSINYLKMISSKLDIGYIVISDSIIISIKHGVDVPNNIEKLKSLCIAIGVLQSTLITDGILIRGAISSGEVYFNNDKNQEI